MKLSRSLVAIPLAALIFSGCSSDNSSEKQPETPPSSAQSADAPTDAAAPTGDTESTDQADPAPSNEDVTAVSETVADYLYHLTLGLEPFFTEYASDSGDDADKPILKSDLDTMFAGAIKLVDMNSFVEEDYAYGMIAAHAITIMTMMFEPTIASSIPDTSDPRFEELAKQALGVKIPAQVVVQGDTAIVPGSAFIADAPDTEGYVDELAEAREGFYLHLTRTDGTWIIDGTVIDQAYFEAMGTPLSEITFG